MKIVVSFGARLLDELGGLVTDKASPDLTGLLLSVTETPAAATEKIFFSTRAVHERNPSEIKITWNQYNLTSNLNAVVQISLWGYRETTIRPELEYINMIEVCA
jgi:hypothetical protein